MNHSVQENRELSKQEGFYIESHDSVDLDELLELTKTNYASGDITNKEYLLWQYHANPFGRPVMEVARQTSTKELVGQYLVIPLSYICKGEKVLGSLSLNTLTREDFRGKGLFTKLAKATYDSCQQKNIKFTIGFPNPNSFPGFVKKLEFKNPGNLQFLVKAISYFGILTDKIKNINSKSQRHGQPISLDEFSDAPLEGEFRIGELSIARDKDAYNSFWSKVSTEYHFTTNRDYNYLKWRYNDLPTRKYKLLKISDNNGIQCVFVLRAQQSYGINTGILVDFFGRRDPQSAELYKKALRAISKYLANKSINLMMTIINQTSPEAAVLRSTGFFPPPQKILPQQFPLIVRNHSDTKDNVFDFNQCYLMFGDYDVI
jgi:hypothetical protein